MGLFGEKPAGNGKTQGGVGLARRKPGTKIFLKPFLEPFEIPRNPPQHVSLVPEFSSPFPLFPTVRFPVTGNCQKRRFPLPSPLPLAPNPGKNSFFPSLTFPPGGFSGIKRRIRSGSALEPPRERSQASLKFLFHPISAELIAWGVPRRSGRDGPSPSAPFPAGIPQ